MRTMAWKLKRAALRERHPEWTQEVLEQAVRDIFLYAST
jgi:hypothetical protein